MHSIAGLPVVAPNSRKQVIPKGSNESFTSLNDGSPHAVVITCALFNTKGRVVDNDLEVLRKEHAGNPNDPR